MSLSPNPSPALRGEGNVATLISDIIQDIRAHNSERPALIGVAGAQGSGKTTVCKLLAAANRPRFAHFSLDDVYLTRRERDVLAIDRCSPLYRTRGAPGTHDLDLALRIIAALGAAAPDSETPIPRFDKTRDERLPLDQWPRHRGKPEVILVDGWCLGARPPADTSPLNDLEAGFDADGGWRRGIREALAGAYAEFFAAFDAIVYLRPPSWEMVFGWRLQQEEQLRGRRLTPAEHVALERFVMHYERITRSMMDGAHMADWVVQLDEARNVVSVANPPMSRP